MRVPPKLQYITDKAIETMNIEIICIKLSKHFLATDVII